MRTNLSCLAALCACASPTTPPTSAGDLAVAITSPAPGDELVAAEHPTITVAGTVTTTSPSYGVLLAWVDGTPVQLDDDGTFSTEITPAVGINHIEVEGGDGFGTTVTQQLDVMWAPDYVAPVTGTSGFDLAGSLDLHLGQGFFDVRQFGTTLDLGTDPVVAHDLASALELILWNIDLASLLGGGIHVGSGGASLDLDIPSVAPGEIVVDATIVDSPVTALDLDIDLNGVFLSTTGTFHNSGTDLAVAGGLSADMHASARLQLGVNDDGSVAVTVTDVTSVVGPLVPSFTGPDADELDGFITIGNNNFRTIVENLIQQQLIPTFTDHVPPLLEALLGATDKLLDNVSFTVDTQLGTPITLTLNGRVAGLDVVAGPAVGDAPGQVTVHQQVSIQASGTPIHTSSRGAVRVAAVPVLPPTNTAQLQLLLSEDFLNATLHALWSSGILEGTVSVSGLSALVSAKLQPVVVPTPDASTCEIDGVRCDLVVQIGQLEIQLPDFSQTFVIDATAGARVVVDGTTVSLSVQQTPTVVVWETSAVPGTLSDDAIRDIITKVVWPKLFGAIGDKLHITLPIPDLAALGLDALSPNLANAQLQLEIHPHAAITAGYLGLGADVELQTP
ncbi:MAG TPA: hypothetical protein VGO00_14945, partial [Kofleriaceae bacterium]|nr:hypothetical protein [Kofleriaceae bacterium]